MKSRLARPLENYFCLMGSTSKTPAPPQKLASSTRKVLKSFWGVIPTKVGCQKPPPRMEIVSDAQGARSSRHVTSISQASDLCCQFYACLSWKPKPPAKIYLKRKYLNPKASVANLRQYAANTLPKNPAQPTSQPKTCPRKKGPNK